MTKKNIEFSLKHLIQSHFDDANKIKEENIKKEELFQAHSKEIYAQIHSNDDQFNDI